MVLPMGQLLKMKRAILPIFNANRKKDHIATGEAIREHFGHAMKLAKGFYTGAKAFVKIARIIRIPPNTFST